MILDGRTIRDKRREELGAYIHNLQSKPGLAIIQVGNNSASSAYIEQKKKFGASIGVRVIHIHLPDNVSFDELQTVIEKNNNDNSVHGIILQLPLPEGIDKEKSINCIDPHKDVDGLTIENKKKLEKGLSCIVPATARGIVTLLDAYSIPIEGKRVVVIGRSDLVGRPTALLMETRGASVQVCHKGTGRIPEKTQQADIIIVATGHPRLVTAEYVAEGQTVIDVGINALSGEHLNEEVPGKKYVGDVDFDDVSRIVKNISPVPGGVGPMTVVSLFENVLDAYKVQAV